MSSYQSVSGKSPSQGSAFTEAHQVKPVNLETAQASVKAAQQAPVLSETTPPPHSFPTWQAGKTPSFSQFQEPSGLNESTGDFAEFVSFRETLTDNSSAVSDRPSQGISDQDRRGKLLEGFDLTMEMLDEAYQVLPKDVQEATREKFISQRAELIAIRQRLNPESIQIVPEILLQDPSAGYEAATLVQQFQDTTITDFDILNPMIAEEAFFREAAIPEVGVVAANILSRAAMAMATGIILNQVEDTIKAKQAHLKELEKQGTDPEKQAELSSEIGRLTSWLTVQQKAFNEQLKKHAIFSTLSAPKAGVAIARFLDKASTATTTLGWVFVGTSLIGAALKYREAKRDVTTHENWTQQWSQEVREGGLQADDVKHIVDNYQGQLERKMTLNQRALDNLLAETLADLSTLDNLHSPKGTQILDRLKELGIELPSIVHNPKHLSDWLSNPDNYVKFNQQMVKKAEAISVQVRNGLQGLSQKKDQIDRSFLKLSLTKAKGLLASVCVVTALTIAFKVLAVVGITVMGAVVVATGYGVLATLLGGMLVGAVYLYAKKPNLFKTYANGVQAKLFFRNIPLAIQQYRHHSASLKAQKTAAKIEVLKLQIDSADEKEKAKLKSSITKKSKKVQALNQKIDSLEGSISEMQEKIKPLQARVIEAGWKDFDTYSRGKKTDTAEMLVEYLSRDTTLQDDVTVKLLFKHMGLDPTSFPNLDKETKGELINSMRAFFALDEGDTLKLIGQQNRLAKMQEEYLKATSPDVPTEG